MPQQQDDGLLTKSKGKKIRNKKHLSSLSLYGRCYKKVRPRFMSVLLVFLPQIFCFRVDLPILNDATKNTVMMGTIAWVLVG